MTSFKCGPFLAYFAAVYNLARLAVDPVLLQAVKSGSVLAVSQPRLRTAFPRPAAQHVRAAAAHAFFKHSFSHQRPFLLLQNAAQEAIAQRQSTSLSMQY